MKTSVLRLLLVTALIPVALTEFNHFLDPSSPVQETLTVVGKGKYYQPFRVDYLVGRSSALGRLVRVPVLPDQVERTQPGSVIDIVVGEGLFRKPWVFPADKQQEYSYPMYKIVYLGFFTIVLGVFSVGYFRLTKQYQNKKRIGAYILATAIGIACFYII